MPSVSIRGVVEKDKKKGYIVGSLHPRILKEGGLAVRPLNPG
jgi:hypothetical protein